MNFICRFNKLTERHYEKSPWPEADYVASLVDGGKLSFSLFLTHNTSEFEDNNKENKKEQTILF